MRTRDNAECAEEIGRPETRETQDPVLKESFFVDGSPRDLEGNRVDDIFIRVGRVPKDR